MASSTAEQTRAVLERHMAAFDSRVVDAILADYAEDAVILTPEGPRRGRAQLRPLFEHVLANVLTPDASFTMIQETIEGEVAYIVWSAESARCRVTMGTDTFVVRGGKIVVQTFAAKVKEKTR